MSAISSSLNNTAVQNASSPNTFNDLTSGEFVKLIFTELANQDPLQPNDTSALMEQLSSLRSIQSDLELGNKLESIVTQNQLASAGGLIGRYISGVSETNTRVDGFVVSVSNTEDGPVLNVDDGRRSHRVPFDNVDEMVDERLVQSVIDATKTKDQGSTDAGGDSAGDSGDDAEDAGG